MTEYGNVYRRWERVRTLSGTAEEVGGLLWEAAQLITKTVPDEDASPADRVLLELRSKIMHVLTEAASLHEGLDNLGGALFEHLQDMRDAAS